MDLPGDHGEAARGGSHDDLSGHHCGRRGHHHWRRCCSGGRSDRGGRRCCGRGCWDHRATARQHDHERHSSGRSGKSAQHPATPHSGNVERAGPCVQVLPGPCARRVGRRPASTASLRRLLQPRSRDVCNGAFARDRRDRHTAALEATMLGAPRGLMTRRARGPQASPAGGACRLSERWSTYRRSETRGGSPKEDRGGRRWRARYSSGWRPRGSVS